MHYVYNRSRKVGQTVRGFNDFIKSNDVLFNDLLNKVIDYDWENPVSYFAKETFKLFGDMKGKPHNNFDENHKEFDNQIKEIENLYFKIKKIADKHFDYEEKHNLERLYHKDFKKLKSSYLQIQNKSVAEKEQMKETLSLIHSKLKEYENQIDNYKKNDFNRTVNVINKRND